MVCRRFSLLTRLTVIGTHQQSGISHSDVMTQPMIIKTLLSVSRTSVRAAGAEGGTYVLLYGSVGLPHREQNRAASSSASPQFVQYFIVFSFFVRRIIFFPPLFKRQAATEQPIAYFLSVFSRQFQLSTNCRQLRVSSLYDIPIGTRVFAFCESLCNVGSAKPPFGSLFLPNGAHRNVFKKANGCFGHWLFPLRHHYTIRRGGMQPQAKNMRASECLRARFPRQVMPPFPQLFAGIFDVRLYH